MRDQRDTFPAAPSCQKSDNNFKYDIFRAITEWLLGAFSLLWNKSSPNLLCRYYAVKVLYDITVENIFVGISSEPIEHMGLSILAVV